MLHTQFAGSMVESVDAKGLPAPHFVSITNCRTDKDGKLLKRFGFATVNETVVSPSGYRTPSKRENEKIFDHLGEAVLADGPSLWSSTPTDGVFWRGRCDSATARRFGVARDMGFTTHGCDSAAGQSYVMTAYTVTDENGISNLFYTIIRDDGTCQAQHVYVDGGVESDWDNIRCIWSPGVGGNPNYFFIFAVDDLSNLLAWSVREDTFAVGILGALATVNSHGTYDACAVEDGFYTTVGTGTPTVVTRLHSVTGAVAATDTIATATSSEDAALFYDGTDVHLAYYDNGTIRYRLLTGGLTVTGVLAVGTGYTVAKSVTGSVTHTIGIVANAPDARVFVVWEDSRTSAVTSSTVYSATMYYAEINVVVPATPALQGSVHFLPNVFPASRPFLRDGVTNNYAIVVGYDGFMQQLPAHLVPVGTARQPRFPDTLAMIEFQGGEFVLDKQAPSVASVLMVDEGVGVARSVGEYRLRNITKLATDPWDQSVAVGKYWSCFAFVPPYGEFAGQFNHEYNHDVTCFDFKNLDRYTAHTYNQLTVLSGGAPMAYDGFKATEFATVVRPLVVECSAYVDAAPGLITTDGTYSVQVVCEYLLRDGSMVRSSPSVLTSCVLDNSVSGENAISVIFRACPISMKYLRDAYDIIGVQAAVYRSTASGDQLKLAKTVKINPEIADYTTVSLLDADAEVEVRREIYTTSEYEATALPSCGVIKESVGRLVANSTERPNVMFYTKELTQNVAPEWNANLAYVTIPGDIVGLEGMDGRTFAFCNDGVYAIEGPFPDSTGSGRRPDVRKISNVRCVSSKTLLCPDGIWFFDGRSMMMLDRKLMVSPALGRLVEDKLRTYSEIRSAVLDQRGRSCRWVVYDPESGVDGEMVYSWANQRWSFNDFAFGVPDDGGGPPTPILTIDSANIGGVYSVLTPDAYHKEDEAGYVDGSLGYGQGFVMGWQRGGENQAGLKRFRRAAFVLKQLGASDLTIDVYYDDQAALTTNHPFPDTVVADGVRVHMKYQKSRSFQIVAAVEAVPGDTGIEFSGMTTEVGLRPTVAKLPAARSL